MKIVSRYSIESWKVSSTVFHRAVLEFDQLCNNCKLKLPCWVCSLHAPARPHLEEYILEVPFEILWFQATRNSFDNFFLLESGGEIQWIGDTFCDDVNNKKACDFDGGDCCGNDVYSNFCTNCTCIGGCKLMLEFHLRDVETGGQ